MKLRPTITSASGRFELRRATVKPDVESCLPKDNWKRATNFFNAVRVVPVRVVGARETPEFSL